MEKDAFCTEVQDKLRKMPLAMRQKWEVKDLYVWWLLTKREASYLDWERVHGDAWRDVLDKCQHLIGRNAI